MKKIMVNSRYKEVDVTNNVNIENIPWAKDVDLKTYKGPVMVPYSLPMVTHCELNDTDDQTGNQVVSK